ncbi:MAG: SRPBCC family protein [Methylobacterium sp.]
MHRIGFGAIAVVTLATGVAQAQHAPTRRKIVEAVEIGAPADKVWAVVGNLKDSNWVEQVVATHEEGEDPAVSTRTLTLGSGRTLVEKGRRYDAERRSFAYYITSNDVRDLPAGDYSATISVVPEGTDRAKVEWNAAFYRGYPNINPPPELNDENSEKAVRAWVHASLENLKTRVEKGGS